MRAGAWSTNRDIAAAVASWRRRGGSPTSYLPMIPDRLSMRISPRALLCGTTFAWAVAAPRTGFDELRDLCVEAGDLRSLAIGTVGRCRRS